MNRVAAPGAVLDKVEVCKAALCEIGLVDVAEQVTPFRSRHRGGIGVKTRSLGHDVNVVMRAVYLAALAVDGPDCPVRCVDHADLRIPHEPCIAVSDALRGMTCGRTT